MNVTDRLYGEFEITSPVILDLYNLPAFQRLSQVSQFGIPDKYYHLTGFSRLEHSVGVYLLLNKMQASEAEQVAGLLHDISHTAFSHLVDWVIGDSQKEDFQDNRHLSVLAQPEIVAVLQKYGYTAEQIADYHSFTLLEADTPDLCADRVDYVSRESDISIAQQCLPALVSLNGTMAFSDLEAAKVFSDNFLDRQQRHWASYEAVTRYNILSELLTRALKQKVIKTEDLYQTDEYVINILLSANIPEYTQTLRLLEHKDLSDLRISDEKVVKKFRYVDPLVVTGETAQRLSQVNPEFADRLAQAKERNKEGIYPGVYLR